jgi:hypothetical protein
MTLQKLVGLTTVTCAWRSPAFACIVVRWTATLRSGGRAPDRLESRRRRSVGRGSELTQTADERRAGEVSGTAAGVSGGLESRAGRSTTGLRLALQVGAGLWLCLLAIGFVAPGGWVWGMAGPIGHIENYTISLWLVGLVLAPLLASVDPSQRTTTIQVYLLAVLAIMASTIRGEPLKLIADGPPLVVAAICVGAVVLAHPDRSVLVRR